MPAMGRRAVAAACVGALVVWVEGPASTLGGRRLVPSPVFSSAPFAAVQPAAVSTRVIGPDGASCTSSAVVPAVRAGGVITFLRPEPVTIRMTRDRQGIQHRREVVIDGGGLVTLSGGGRRRILYMNTCDGRRRWTTSHCQDQATPRLTVAEPHLRRRRLQRRDEAGAAARSASAAAGSRSSIPLLRQRLRRDGPDVGGGAMRVLRQYHGLPVTSVGAVRRRNMCCNGGALSSIGVSWIVPIACSRQPRDRPRRQPGTGRHPGGGSGGAIYNDGNR